MSFAITLSPLLILYALGIVILGDFNHLNIHDLIASHNLKQVVTRPTRQDSILDYTITNLKSFHKTPEIFAPLDHQITM